ncbi:hypothetical protein EA58_19450 [Photobacterium galatheae]|uniref:Uncharacterized protein n=1 Tax=Photobacterium galatheae TaxID=1654360 RepID=A0A066RLW3_9GAMM|nr:hypothetical protein EA58_19450 [Photobacterium galatheae]
MTDWQTEKVSSIQNLFTCHQTDIRHQHHCNKAQSPYCQRKQLPFERKQNRPQNIHSHRLTGKQHE